MPDLDEKYNEFSRELSQSVSPETEPTKENICDERSYDERLKDIFQGKIVRKDLTKKIKEGANVEIDAGDTYAYDAEALQSQKAREDAAKQRIFAILPEEQAQELIAIFDEFEEYETAESKFAHAMDNI